jgi:hypothetical protein
VLENFLKDYDISAPGHREEALRIFKITLEPGGIELAIKNIPIPVRAFPQADITLAGSERPEAITGVRAYVAESSSL